MWLAHKNLIFHYFCILKMWSKTDWRNFLLQIIRQKKGSMFFYNYSHLAFRYQMRAGEQFLVHFDSHGKIHLWESITGLCLLLIICIYVHLQNDRRPPVATYSISLAESGQPVSLPGRCLTTFLKTFNDGDSTTSSGALYLEERKTALDVNCDVNINWKCLWRQICLIGWDINIYCWCQSFGQIETILSFQQNWNKFKPNHVVMPSMTGMLLISFLPVLKWKLPGLLLWFLMR